MAPTTTSPTHIPTDPRVLLEQAMATGNSVVEAVRPDQLANPTPCAGMDVRGMLAHLIGVLDRIGALGRAEDPFAVTEASATDDDWVTAWTSATHRASEAWADDEVLERPMALPWIEGTGADVLASYFSELTVHTWDLAVATAQAPAWDEAVVQAALEASQFLPAENRLGLFQEVAAEMGLDEVAVPFAEAVPIPSDAPPIDRLVAWNGRQPRR